MITKSSIVTSLPLLSIQSLIARPLVWSLVMLSLCVGLARVTPPELTPRLLGRLWGALPPYTLVVRGGDSCVRCRSVAGNPLESGVRLDAPLDIVLRPTLPVVGPVFVFGYLRHAGRLSFWPVVMEPTGDGALQLGGIVRDLLDLPDSARGAYELLFVIQRSPLPPSYATVQARLQTADGGVAPQLLHYAVEILAPATP